MKLKDMLLITNNNKGTEYRYLAGIEDYLAILFRAFEGSEIEMSHAIKELCQTKENGLWTEVYLTANKTYHARFCRDEKELRNFLSGNHKMTEGGSSFDRGRCPAECLDVLRLYGMDCRGKPVFGNLHYECLPRSFKQGEILHNFNGSDYIVLMVLDKNDLFVMSLGSGNYYLAEGVHFYARYPQTGTYPADNIVEGIEWGGSIYLGSDLAAINIDSIQKKSVGTDYDELEETDGEEDGYWEQA